jgi:hypothetical protein
MATAPSPAPSIGFSWADFAKDLEFALGILKTLAPVLDTLVPAAAPIVGVIETVAPVVGEVASEL